MIESFQELLTGETVTVHVDNLNAARILTVGSSKKHLQEICLDIFKFCLKRNIKLIAQWIPREKNTKADELSKFNDTDDWTIDFSSFSTLKYRYGPFSIDRFADNYNKKVPRFNSKHYCPGTSAVNAFTENWSNENNWMCPPINLIGSTIRHIKFCKGKGTLLIPMWKSTYFWPIIYPNGIRMASFVKDFTVLEPYFISNTNSIFSGYTNFRCIALFIEHR